MQPNVMAVDIVCYFIMQGRFRSDGVSITHVFLWNERRSVVTLIHVFVEVFHRNNADTHLKVNVRLIFFS